MKNLIKNNMLQCLKKRNIIIFVLACISVIFIFKFYYETQYENYSLIMANEIQEEIQKAEINYHSVENRLNSLKENQMDSSTINKYEAILSSWQQEADYANYLRVLWLSDKTYGNETEILNTLEKRDVNAFNVIIDDKLILDYSGMYRSEYRDLLNRKKLSEAYSFSNTNSYANPITPTGAYLLSEGLNGFNPMMILILLCLIAWNADIWSKEFDHNGYQLYFTLPYKRSELYLARFLVHCLFSLLGIVLLLLLLFILGSVKYGHGFNQMLIINQQGLNSLSIFETNSQLLSAGDFPILIQNAILYKALLMSLYYFCFISFVNFTSLLCKERGLSIFVPIILILIIYMVVQTTNDYSLIRFIPPCYLLTSVMLMGGMGVSLVVASLVLIIISLFIHAVTLFYIKHVDLKGIR